MNSHNSRINVFEYHYHVEKSLIKLSYIFGYLISIELIEIDLRDFELLNS